MSLKMSHLRQNEVANLIKGAGFLQADFDFNPTSESIFAIVYKPIPDYTFTVLQDQKCVYSPGADGKLRSTVSATDWTQTKTAAKNWLIYLKKNVKVMNVWKGISNIDSLKIQGSEDAHFLTEEISLLNEKVDIILEGLLQFANDIDRIKSDLEYLKFSSEKVSRKDWGLMFMGSFFGWITDKVIPAEHVDKIFHSIKETFMYGNNLLSK